MAAAIYTLRFVHSPWRLVAMERNDRATVEAVLGGQIAQNYMAWQSESSPLEVVAWCESIRRRAAESELFKRIVDPPELADDDRQADLEDA